MTPLRPHHEEILWRAMDNMTVEPRCDLSREACDQLVEHGLMRRAGDGYQITLEGEQEILG